MTVTAIRAPAGTPPASDILSRPATEAADPGSTKIPSSRERTLCAARISSSVTESMSPPEASRASIARSQLAGVADADRRGDRVRIGHGVAEDERGRSGGLEAPHLRQARRDADPVVLVVALPSTR